MAGVIIAMAPLPVFLGAIGSIFFDADQILADAQGDPKVVAGYMAQRLVPVVLSLVTGMVAFLIATISTGFGSYRARWFFWSLVGVAVVYALAFPVGTVIAIVCATVLYRKKAEFFPNISAETPDNDA